MDLFEKANIITYHRQRPGADDFYKLGYRSTDSQILRFQGLLHWGNFSDSTILDLGCGYGDLKLFLDQHAQNFTYLGLDFIKEFIVRAQERYGNLANTHFLQSDFLNAGLPEVDIIVASGSLNYRSTNPYHPWECINRMWEAANKGIAFNLLDANYFENDTILCGYDRVKVLSFCKYLDPDTQIFSGYLPDDFTVLMRK